MQNRLLAIGVVITFGSVANADVVLNNLSFTMGDHDVSQASQDFEASLNQFDVATIDDFTVTASQTLVQSVEVILSGWIPTGFTNANYSNGVISSYRVEFYTSLAAATANLTGDAGSTSVAFGSSTVTVLGWTGQFAGAAHVVLPVNVTLPGAGTYWMGIMPVMDFAAGGQIGVDTILPALDNQNAYQANPAGGFAIPGNLKALNLDASYKIDAVPEPASMIALGLGVTALLARRRKKA